MLYVLSPKQEHVQAALAGVSYFFPLLSLGLKTLVVHGSLLGGKFLLTF